MADSESISSPGQLSEDSSDPDWIPPRQQRRPRNDPIRKPPNHSIRPENYSMKNPPRQSIRPENYPMRNTPRQSIRPENYPMRNPPRQSIRPENYPMRNPPCQQRRPENDPIRRVGFITRAPVSFRETHIRVARWVKSVNEEWSHFYKSGEEPLDRENEPLDREDEPSTITINSSNDEAAEEGSNKQEKVSNMECGNAANIKKNVTVPIAVTSTITICSSSDDEAETVPIAVPSIITIVSSNDEAVEEESNKQEKVSNKELGSCD